MDPQKNHGPCCGQMCRETRISLASRGDGHNMVVEDEWMHVYMLI